MVAISFHQLVILLHYYLHCFISHLIGTKSASLPRVFLLHLFQNKTGYGRSLTKLEQKYIKTKTVHQDLQIKIE